MYIAIFEFSIQLSFSQYLFYSTNLLVLLPLPKEKIVDYGKNNNSTRSDLRERGFYYVDKTNYIPGLEDYNAPVFLRPRRFGKSLLISSRLTTTTVQRRIVLKNSSAVPGLANILRKSIINIW